MVHLSCQHQGGGAAAAARLSDAYSDYPPKSTNDLSSNNTHTYTHNRQSGGTQAVVNGLGQASSCRGEQNKSLITAPLKRLRTLTDWRVMSANTAYSGDKLVTGTFCQLKLVPYSSNHL